jgi:hypothetical protein
MQQEKTPKPATAKQLRYLRALADSRGCTFAWPSSSAEASAEINRLRKRRRSPGVERRLDQVLVADAMKRPKGADVRADSETVGYGSEAHWQGAAGSDADTPDRDPWRTMSTSPAQERAETSRRVD